MARRRSFFHVARYQHLPLYQSCFGLTREIYRLRLKLPKLLKHDLGRMAFESALSCLRFVIVANGEAKKEPTLRSLALEIECLWAYSRLLYELRGISAGEFKVLSARLTEIASQTQAWITWERKQKKKESVESL